MIPGIKLKMALESVTEVLSPFENYLIIVEKRLSDR